MQPVITGVIVAVISALFTFMITTLAMRNGQKIEAEASVKTHVEIWHKETLRDYVDNAVKTHTIDCNADERLRKIEKVVLAIYIKQGGSINELDI